MIVNTTFNPQLSETAGVKMDLLWENASPSSTFSAQTIVLDASNYKFLLLNTPDTEENYVLIPGMKGYFRSLYAESTNIRWGLFRNYSWTDDGISFNDTSSVNLNSASSSITIDNRFLKPLYIWGVS